MKLIKITMVCSIALIGLAITSCKKEKYTSRDTSHLVPEPEEPEEPVDPTQVVFDSADSKDGWQTVGDPFIETSGAKEGDGYLKNTIKNGDDFMQFIKKLETPVNSTFNKENGQFKFWWYISDVSAIKKDGSIEITSSGKADDHESAWDVGPLLDNLKNGWNEVTLDLSTAINSSDGGADLSAINFFRVFFWTSSKDHPEVTVGIDDLRFAGK